MSKNINVEQLAEEIFPQVIDLYEKDLKERLLEAEDGESLAVVINAATEALRLHSERFTTILIQKVVDELNQDSDE